MNQIQERKFVADDVSYTERHELTRTLVADGCTVLRIREDTAVRKRFDLLENSV